MTRKNYVPTRLNDDEKLALDALAKNEGITSLSEMIRHLIRSEAKRLGLWKVKDNDHQ